MSFAITARRGWWYVLSLVLLAPGIVALLTGGLKPGIDFTGGALLHVRFEQPVTQHRLQSVISDAGYNNTTVQLTEDNSALVRVTQLDIVQKDELLEALFSGISPGQELSFSSIGPVVGSEMTRAALLAVVIASALILIYIIWAFRRMEHPAVLGLAAICALLHDALFLLGLFAVLGHVIDVQVDALFVTAILTVIGFSVNDTIVVFDRIRENREQHRKLPDSSRPSFETTVNMSINQSLTRSLNTSLTAMVVLFALIVLGGPTIRLFAVALAAGFAIGTYSSLFNASCLVVSWAQSDGIVVWRRIHSVLQRKDI
jgi:preprotein translocase subunit SecF